MSRLTVVLRIVLARAVFSPPPDRAFCDGLFLSVSLEILTMTLERLIQSMSLGPERLEVGAELNMSKSLRVRESV